MLEFLQLHNSRSCSNKRIKVAQLHVLDFYRIIDCFIKFVTVY